MSNLQQFFPLIFFCTAKCYSWIWICSLNLKSDTIGDLSMEFICSRAKRMLRFRGLCFIILNKKNVLSVCLFSMSFLVKYFPHENMKSVFNLKFCSVFGTTGFPHIYLFCATFLLSAVHFLSVNAVQKRGSFGFPYATIKENFTDLSALTFWIIWRICINFFNSKAVFYSSSVYCFVWKIVEMGGRWEIESL